MKVKLIIIIDLSLRKRQSWLQRIKLNYKFWEPKKKKKKQQQQQQQQKTIHGFIFITSLSFGVLVG